jgi:hypothetical protein
MSDDKAAALREYEDVLTFYLTHSLDTQDSNFGNLRMKMRMHEADLEVERLGLRGTPEYNEAVLCADKNALALRSAGRV